MTYTHADLDALIASIEPADESWRARAVEFQLDLTKPEGSLGQLELVGNQLCAIYRECPPHIPAKARACIFVADHGVQVHKVSPWPQEVTVQMAINILHGGASVNVLGAQCNVDVQLTDLGMLTPLPADSGIIDRRISAGTADMLTGPAMSREQVLTAIGVGVEAAKNAIAEGYDILIPGEIGIGNTTAAAALISVFTGRSASETTGRGAGALDDMYARKQQVVDDAIARNQAHAADPLGALAGVGGYEHAAMVGLLLAAAAHRVPVILDGVICCSAALVAHALCPAATSSWIAGHNGAEQGIGRALEGLGLTPLVSLGMRLGEGGGAAVALPIVQMAARVFSMATFSSAGVDGRED
ncbi:MAG: nicotinate-nucleotide--dimethylbenzimidazole phosphoribosyltransferase [Propionibacteriaceae bacterium]